MNALVVIFAAYSWFIGALKLTSLPKLYIYQGAGKHPGEPNVPSKITPQDIAFLPKKRSFVDSTL